MVFDVVAADDPVSVNGMITRGRSAERGGMRLCRVLHPLHIVHVVDMTVGVNGAFRHHDFQPEDGLAGVIRVHCRTWQKHCLNRRVPSKSASLDRKSVV